MNISTARKLAWSFARTTGLDVDELFQEACLAGLKAEEQSSYDPSRGATKDTFLYWKMKTGLLDYIKKLRREKEKGEDIPVGDDIQVGTEVRYGFLDEVNNLSRAAQEAWNMLYKNPHEYLALGSKKARGELKTQLREQGWSWPKIRQALNELRSLAREG